MELEPDDVLDSVFRVLCVNPSRLDDMDPFQVYAYVKQMIKHKVISAQRRRTRLKRGNGFKRMTVDLNGVQSCTLDVTDEVAINEEVILAKQGLSPEERMICQYRSDNFSWEQIGELMEMSSPAARKRYERALTRTSTRDHQLE